jgi:serine/threonine protein kinase
LAGASIWLPAAGGIVAKKRRKKRRKKKRKQPKPRKRPIVDSFDLRPGRRLAAKYEVVASLGTGWEGEVYKIREVSTGIERAAKFFFPQRNPNNRTLTWYAKKLHKLRHCPIVIQYQTQERIVFRRHPITFLVSEYVEGELLSTFLRRQPGQRLSVFQGLHLLHALAAGIESIHALREYHGDLHTDNVIVRRYGLGFNLKLVDMFRWQMPKLQNIQDDVVDLIKIFHEAVGGLRHYARLPREAKQIICGLKRSLILKKFRTAGHLRRYLETLQWR